MTHRDELIRDGILDRLPGAEELRAMCESANAVLKLCELVGVMADEHPHPELNAIASALDEPFAWENSEED